MFGTSGIRGIYGKEVNEELAVKIGNIFPKETVVVARDIRKSGKTLSMALISGILSKGYDVIDIGIATTPTLALASKNMNCDGIMITASHNPPEYNGLKFFFKGGEIPKERELEIAEKYKNEDIAFCSWNKIGKIQKYEDAVLDHIKLIKKMIDIDLIKKKNPKVVLDCNGPASLIAPKLMEEIGCKVIPINTSIEKFERASEPNKKNLSGLLKKVIETGADFGIGYDGDADRAIVVDETGCILPFDVQLALIIENEIAGLAGEKKVVTTIEASLIVKEAIEKNNAEYAITPVGSIFVSKEMKKDNGIFGGEPCGEYIFKNGVSSPDGILTGAKFAEIFCRCGKFSKLIKKYAQHPIVREKFECENSKKYEVVEKIKGKINIEGEKRVDDGIRIDQKDGWFLIRASGTEPYIRLTMEYKDDKKLYEMHRCIFELIKSNI